MTIKTNTPIGTFEVDPSTAKMVHALKNGQLTLNRIVYRGVINNGGVIRQGYTFSTSINEDLIGMIVEWPQLLIDDSVTLFPVNGGYAL